jgi:hypothetical protein
MPGPLVEERHNANHELLTKATRTPVGYSPRDRSAHSLAPHCRSPSLRRTAFSFVVDWPLVKIRQQDQPAAGARDVGAGPFDEHSGRGASISFKARLLGKFHHRGPPPLSAPITAARASWFCTGRRGSLQSTNRRNRGRGCAIAGFRRLPGQRDVAGMKKSEAAVGDPDRQLLFPCIRGISVSPNPSHR